MNETIQRPAELLRISSMLQSLLREVEDSHLDDQARNRLERVHRKAVAAVRESVSDDLGDELERLDLFADTASGAELRVVQAQLLGWLEGVLRSAELAAVHRLADSVEAGHLAAQATGAGNGNGNGSPVPAGPYL